MIRVVIIIVGTLATWDIFQSLAYAGTYALVRVRKSSQIGFSSTRSRGRRQTIDK